MEKKYLVIIISLIIIILSYFSYVELTGMVAKSIIDTCTDSDSGLEYWTKGEITGKTFNTPIDQQGLYSKEDYCQSNNLLVEYYCKMEDSKANKQVAEKRFFCKQGCENGKCIGKEAGPSILERLVDIFILKP